VFNSVPPIVVESLPGRSNRSLTRLTLHIHGDEITPSFLMLNMNIRLCLPKALTLAALRWYEIFQVLLIVRISKKHRSLGNTQLPPAQRWVSVLAGERDSSPRQSSTAYTMQRLIHTLSCSPNKSRVAVITYHVTSTPSTTLQWSINTATTTPGTSSQSPRAP